MATSVNRAPVVSGKGTFKYTEGDAAKTVAGSLTVTDVDSASLTGATVRISKGFAAGQDVLGFTLVGGISGSYDAATGVLTLSGVGSVADYQSVLRSVTYWNGSDAPTVTQRQIDFQVSDGIATSKVVSSKISVVPVNDLPTLGGWDNLIYTQLLTGTRMALDASVDIGDLDNPELTGMTVQITGGYIKNQDFLEAYETVLGVKAKWDAKSGTLTFTGKASQAQYETMLQNVTYHNDEGATANLTPRTVTVKINDGKGLVAVATSQIIFATPPVLTGDGGTTNYTENAAAVAVDGSLGISDLDDTNLESATVRVSANFQAGDVLGFVDTASITGSYNAGTGVLTLTGTASIADYQAAIRSVTFSSTNDNPTATKTIEYTVNDGQANSNAVTHTLATTPVNDAPALMLAATVDTTIGYTENDAATLIAPAATLADPDSPDFNTGTLTVAFAANGTTDDQLEIRSQGNAAGQIGVSGANISYGGAVIGTFTGGANGTSLVITFTTAAATRAAVEALVKNITYRNASDNPSGLARNVTFTLTDGDGGTDAGMPDATINFTVVNDVPVVTATAGSSAYTEGGAAATVDAAITVADIDDTNIESASIAITTGLQAGDSLLFVNTANITGAYNAGTGVLTLTGTDTVAAYQAALQSIAFSTTNDDPVTAKTVTFTVNDGGGDSVAVTRGIAVTPVNDPPVLDLQAAAPAYTENGAAIVLAGATTLVEPDSDSYNGGSVAVSFTANGTTDDVLAVRNEGAGAGQVGVDGANVTYGGVTIGTWSGGTAGGTLTISFTSTAASTAAVQALLRNITYVNTSDNPSGLDRTVAFTVTDGDGTANGGANSDTESLTLTVTPVNDAPVIAATTGNVAYTEGGAAVVVDGTLTVADVDDTNIESASFTISGNFQAGDALNFVDTANITGNYNAGTGVLTLTGTDTLAAYQAALRTITFSTTNDDPFATRTVSWLVNDGALDSNTGTRTIDVTPVNDPPVITSGATLNYTENDSATVISAGVTVTDADSANFAGGSLTVAFTANGAAQDQLAVRNVGVGAGQVGVSGSSITYEGTTIGTFAGGANGSNLVISLNAGASVAATQALARNITYFNNSHDPSTLARTVTFTLVDGDGTALGGDEDGTTTATVNVQAVNDAPTTTASGGTAAYTEGGSAVIVDPGLGVFDVDDTELASATVWISAGLQAGDVLASSGSGLTVNYDAGTATLTFTGAASKAVYESAIRNITFETTNDNPAASKTVSWYVNDGDVDSGTTSRSITVTPVNDAPVLTLGPAALVYTENAAPTAIAPGAVISDADSPTFAGAYLEVNVQSGSGFPDDRLTVIHQGNGAGQIGVSGNVISYEGTALGIVDADAHGIGTTLHIKNLTSAATVAAVQALVRAVAFSSVSDNPVSTTRNYLFIIVDDHGDFSTAPATVTVTPVNDASTVTASGGSTAYTEQAASVVVDGSITISDPDDTQLNGATVTIAAGHDGEDALVFTNTANITGVFNPGTGVLTLSGTDTVAAYEAALRSVRFSSTDNSPAANITVEWFVNDGDTNSNTTSKTIAVTAVNDAPGISTAAAVLNYTENASPTAIAPSGFVADIDSADFNGGSLLVSFTANGTAADQLGVLDVGNGAGQIGVSGSTVSFGGVAFGTIHGTLNGINGASLQIAFTTNASQAAVSALVKAIAFANTSDTPSTAARTVNFLVNDGDGGATPTANATATVNVSVVNDAPVVTPSGGNTSFTEAGPAVVIDGAITVSDIDSANMSSATVQITGNYQNGSDTLAYTGSGNITAGAFNAATGTLTLTSAGGTATASDWATALQQVTFANNSISPGATRAITFQLDDGDGGANLSTASVKNIAITEVNTAPALANAGSASFIENAAAVAVHTTITVGDPDTTTIASATVSITTNFTNTEDVLGFANTANITGSYNAGTGVLTLTGVDTLAAYEAALRTVTYNNTSDTPNTAARTVVFQVDDGQGVSNLSNTVSSTVSVTSANDAPVLAAGGTLGYTENDAAKKISSTITVADLDSANFDTGSLTIGFTADGTVADQLSISNDGVGAGQIGTSGANVTFAGTTIGTFAGGANGANLVVTLNANATPGAVQALSRAIAFANTSENPSALARTVTFTVVDGGAVPNTGSTTATINITNVNDAPDINTAAAALAYIENGPAAPVAGAATVTDIDSTDFQGGSLTVGFTANGTLADQLAIAAVGGITVAGANVSFGGNLIGTFGGGTNGSNLVVSFTTVDATPAAVQALSRAIAFSNSSDNPSTLARTLTYTLVDGDGGTQTDTATATVNVTAVNDAPVIANALDTVTFTENAAPLLIDNSLTVSDPEVNSITGATVTIGSFASGQDVLAFTDNLADNITGSYNATSGVLTFTGTDTLANYEAMLESVTYQNTSDNPTGASRVITFQVTDNGTPIVQSGNTTSTVSITAVNDAPVTVTPSSGTLGTAMSNVDFAVPGVSISDVDANSGNLQTTITVTNGTVNVTLGGATVAAGALNSTTVTLQGTVAQLNTALGTLTFKGTDGITAPQTATVSVITTDLGNTGTGGPLQSDSGVANTFQIGVIPQVFVIDNADGTVDTANSGTIANPFNTINALDTLAVDGTNDIIYLRTGSGTYSEADGFDLLAGQQLIGNGQALSFTNPVTLAVTTFGTAGTAPTVSITGASNTGVTVATGNTVKGLNFATTASNQIAINDTAGGFGTLTINDVDISGSGQAVDLDQGGTLAVTIDNLSSSGGAYGFRVYNATGTFTATNGALSGHTTSEVDLSGGTAAITFGGTIGDGTGLSASIANRTGGNVSLTGNINDSSDAGGGITVGSNSGGGTITFSGGTKTINTVAGNGIDLTNNGGTTISFTNGGLNLDSTSGTAFSATGGGTLTLSGSNNSIASGTGRAVNIDGVTSTINLLDVSASGGSTTAVFLKNTGAGSFTVTGTASNAGSGGTISNISGGDLGSLGAAATSGTGIYLENVSDVSLSNMTLSGAFTNYGIRGENVTNFTLRDSSLNGTYGTSEGQDEGAIRFGTENNSTGIKGTALFEGNVIGGGFENNLSVFLYGSDTLNMTVRDSANDQAVFNVNGTGLGDDSLHVESGGTGSNLTLSVLNAQFNGARGDQLQVGQIGVTTQNLTVTGNQFINSHSNTVSGGGGVWLLGGSTAASSNATVTYNVSGNTIRGALGDAFRATYTGYAATINGIVANNTIGNPNGVAETVGSAGGAGIDVGAAKAAGTGTMTYAVRIQNNTVRDAKFATGGIMVTAGGPGGAGVIRVEATVTGNTVSESTDALAGFYGIVGGSGGADASILGLALSGNTFASGTTSGGNAIYLDQILTATNAHYNIPGYTVNANTSHGSGNPVAGGGTASTALSSFWSGSNTLTNGPFPGVGGSFVEATNTIGITNAAFSLPVPLFVTPPQGDEVQPDGTAAPVGTTLESALELRALMDAAIARWAAAGATQAELDVMGTIILVVDDLPGALIGGTTPGRITIDSTAGGYGWFVDPTPMDDSEFAAGVALPGSAAAGSVDLLTALMHEFGHVIGHDDSFSPGGAGLMNGHLALGQRVLPAVDQAGPETMAQAVSHAVLETIALVGAGFTDSQASGL